MSIKVLQSQSLIDLAIQEAGSAEAAFALAAQNGRSITDEPATGEELLSVPVSDRGIRDYYANKNLRPATGLWAEIVTPEKRIFTKEFNAIFS